MRDGERIDAGGQDGRPDTPVDEIAEIRRSLLGFQTTRPAREEHWSLSELREAVDKGRTFFDDGRDHLRVRYAIEGADPYWADSWRSPSSTPPHVLIQVNAGAKREDVVRLLLKIALNFEQPDEIVQEEGNWLHHKLQALREAQRLVPGG
jgi:hypothetical protein